MTNLFLDPNYWQNDFAITDGDLNRLEEVLREAGAPQWATRLLQYVVEYKLARDSNSLDPLERAKSAQAAEQFLGEAETYHPTQRYEIGQEIYVARRFKGKWQIGRGPIIGLDRSQREPVMEIEVPGESKTWFFVCGLPPDHRLVRSHCSPLSGEEQTADQVLEAYSAELLPHLQGRLAEDARFVNWGDQWWLVDAVRSLSEAGLDHLHGALVRTDKPSDTSALLSLLEDNWADTPGNRFTLNRALLAAADRFENVGTDAEPRWRALLPAHVIRLADGTLLDLSLPPDEFWAEHYALFAGPLPDELRDHPALVQIHGRWLLRSLLVPFDAEALETLGVHLDDVCEARSDVDLLALFGKGPQDDDWHRWRFSLAWALREEAERMGVEFVGTGEAWRWALREAPLERPERHRPIRGRDGLPVEIVTVPVEEVASELSEVDAEEPEQEPEAWEPTAQEWSYTLTYYDWQHGILPYRGDARAIIPPLAEGQIRALFHAVVPQVSDEVIAFTLRSHERTPWLQSEGLLELCQGFHLVPGARIRLLRTEMPGQYTLLYTPAPEQACRVLMFDRDSLHPRIQEVTFACEVDPDMLLAESRYANVQAWDRLFRVDRRTAPKVLANVFEVIGEYDQAEDVYRARFCDLFPLLCVTKPYSLSYVQQILARSRTFPWFYPDRQRRGDWYIYDAKKTRRRERVVVRRPSRPIPDLAKPNAELAEVLRKLEADPSRMRSLEDAVSQYRLLPGRAQVLLLREHAHNRIRTLLAQDALDGLTLDAFNRFVWQDGDFEVDGRLAKWQDWGLPRELIDYPLDQLEIDLASGRVVVTGNASWGSGAHVYGAMLRASDDRKLATLKRALESLLYGTAPVGQRIRAADQESNGLGLNIITGMLHALWPNRYTLFNSAAVASMQRLLPWVSWKRDAVHYFQYQQACKWFLAQEVLRFGSLTDLDWFVFNVSKDRVPVDWSAADKVSGPQMPGQAKPAAVTGAPQELPELWQAIEKLAGQELHTLAEGQAFTIVRATDRAVHFRVASSGRSYQIGRSEITMAWETLRNRSHLAQAALRAELNLAMPVYIAALLAALPGVTHTTRPIVLHYQDDSTPEKPRTSQQSPATAEPPAPPPTERRRDGQVAMPGMPKGPLFDGGTAAGSEPPPPGQALKPKRELELPGWPEAGEDQSPELPARPVNYWITPLRSVPELSAEECIRDLVGDKNIYAFSDRTPGRKEVGSGDQICFYIGGGVGVVGHATVASKPVYRPDPRIHDCETWPWTFRLRNTHVYLDKPITVDSELRTRLDAFEGRDPDGVWGWFVLGLRKLSRHDFYLLIGQQPREPEARPSPPPTERRRDGQTAMPGMPKGPLFDDTTAEDPRPDAPRSQPPRAARGPRIRRDEMQAKTLFSRHYMENRLPDHPEWGEDPRASFDKMRTLWQKARTYGSNWNEAQTEDEFVRPVLEALGWFYTVQPKATKAGKITRPDYALFPSQKVKNEASRYLGQDDPFYSRAAAIAEAKYWERPLSQKDASGRNTWKTGSNPSHQMVSYLVGTCVPWGILTNGTTWRLYSREVSSTASEYYEVDLGLIFDFLPDGAEPTPEQLDQFRRWWLFFRRDAFITDARGRSFVRRVHESSATYAREISDKLKELVFEEVVPQIAGGFVTYRARQRGIREESDETLGEIYAATLSLLYKLLFLLYAEARNLLPVDNPTYREQSLTALAQWAAERVDKKLALSDAVHATARYDALRALFHRIDQGDPSLGIPRYNGGLFNPATPENQFLERHRLSDRAVARAVDTLVRDAGEPVDYAYISVRNLGAIYEGLLENKLRVVDAAAGKVELVNDKGERKASGSYYTPDYIVEYIVQHTLEPVLDERRARFETAMDRCAGLRRQLADPRKTGQVGLLREQLEGAERDAREAFLGIKVCDPAMGSGHFLVNAVDHLTDGIILRMQAYHDAHPEVEWAWNPINKLIESVRGQILAEMGRQSIALNSERLDDTALLTRLVMKRCIYGVDLNPLAVELAKLSLWLHSFTVGAPLSFLDHHLRWGDSLIGTDVRTVQREIGASDRGPAVQLNLFAGPFAGLLDLTALMTEVAEQADATLADVQQSAETFAEFQRQLTPYKQVLDLWVSQHFGNKLASEFLTLYSGDVLPAIKGERKVGKDHQAAIEQARELWRDKRFFHWDLEFPEVSVDLRKRDWTENPGFDAVIGNPPYASISELSRQDRDYLKVAFSEIYAGNSDILYYFLSLSSRLPAAGGWLGFIVARYFQEAKYARALRMWLAQQVQLRELVDFGNFQVFGAEVNILAAIVVLNRTPPVEDSVTQILRLGDDRVTAREVAGGLLNLSTGLFDGFLSSHPNQRGEPWFFSSHAASLIDERLRSCSVKLADITQIVQSMQSGRNQVLTPSAELIRRYDIEAELLHPIAKAGSIGRYYFEELDRKLIWTEGIDLDSYPNLRDYLVPHKRDLASRYDIQNRGANWWEISNPRNAELFLGDVPRILVPFVATGNKFCLDRDQHLNDGGDLRAVFFSRKTSYSPRYVCALLNSRLMQFYHLRHTKLKRGGYYEYFENQLAQLPIRHIAFNTGAESRRRQAKRGIQLYKQLRTKNDYTSLRAFVTQHLQAERTDAVHDLLAHLAEQMIEMHRERQEHQRTFRLDLAGYLDEKQQKKLNRLYTPKKPPREGVKNYERRLARYEEAVKLAQAQLGSLAGETLNLEDFWRLNPGQWQWVLRQNLGNVDSMSKLAGLYEQYRKRLAPLMRTIQRTDWLIDQVVYQLYGLSEEEIAIVEGRER